MGHTMHHMHLITPINMRGRSSNNNKNNRTSDKVAAANDAKWKIFLPSSLDKQQERSASYGSTISTGHIKEMLLSPIAACKSPGTPPHSAPCSSPASPKHRSNNKQQQFPVQSSPDKQPSNMRNGRKKALYRNRTSPPQYNKNSIPRTNSSPSLSSSHDAGYGGVVGEDTSLSSELLIGENLVLDNKAAMLDSWNEVESSYSSSSREHLLDNNKNNNKATMSSSQQQPHQSCSYYYDCNYNYTQEKAYEEFGVERKLIDKNMVRSSSSTSSSSCTQQPSKNKTTTTTTTTGGKKKKHWIRLRQSMSSTHASSQGTLPRKPSSSFTCLKKVAGSSLSSSSLNLPPSGKPSTTGTAAARKSAPPTYFNVDVFSRGYHRGGGPREENDGHYSVGYYSAPIEMELRPDRSLSQMGMEVTEEDYCIEGEYMSRQFQQQQQHQQQHNVPVCTSNPRKGGKKLSESVFSIKELAKGLESSARSKPCSPKVIKTKVLSALRKVGSGGELNVTKDASGGSKKKIPHQIDIAVSPSSEETAEDRLSLDDMEMLYKWQKARCRKDVSRFSSSRGGGVSCNTDDDCTHNETAITKTTMSEDVMSITSSVGDRTVSVDNRRRSMKRQVSF